MKIYARAIIVHPFLVSLFPILSLYAHNYSELSFGVLFIPAAALLLISLFLLLLSGRIIGSYNKAAVYLSLFYLWFFSYEPARNILYGVSDLKIYRHRYFILIWLLFGLAGAVLASRIKFNAQKATRLFNICATALLLFAIIPLFLPKPKEQASFPEAIALPVESSGYLPDIYYIILDAYASNNGLTGFLGFNNSEFVELLKANGFYVAEKSHSNYSWTRPCVSSTLNMEYLPIDSTSPPENRHLSPAINYNRMISTNRVVARAKSLGYEFIDLSIWRNSYLNRGRYVNFESDVYDFISALMHMTVLGKPVVENYIAAKAKRHSIEKKFHDLETISKAPNKIPKFVYAHFMVPHEPFVFNKDGTEYLFFTKLLQGNMKDLYLNQLQYTNIKVASFLSTIFSAYDSLHLPIIIIQGDHGPRDLLSDFEQKARLRTCILNAYFFPGEGRKELYETITPVNSFRAVFRHYFHMELPPLEDKTYFQVRDHLGSPLKSLVFGK